MAVVMSGFRIRLVADRFSVLIYNKIKITLAASYFFYLYHALKVCTVRKKSLGKM